MTGNELIEMGMKLIKAGCEKNCTCVDCPFSVECVNNDVPTHWIIAREDGTTDEI